MACIKNRPSSNVKSTQKTIKKIRHLHVFRLDWFCSKDFVLLKGHPLITYLKILIKRGTFSNNEINATHLSIFFFKKFMLIISPFAAGTFGTGVFWNSLFNQSPCSREAKVCWGGRGGVVRVRGPWMTAGDVSACPWLICWRTSVTTFCPEVVILGSRLCVYLMLFGFLTDDFEKMKKKIHNPKTVKKFLS